MACRTDPRVGSISEWQRSVALPIASPLFSNLLSGLSSAEDLSPDRLDALVWAVSELAVDSQPPLALVNTNTMSRRDSVDHGWLRDILLRPTDRKVGPQ